MPDEDFPTPAQIGVLRGIGVERGRGTPAWWMAGAKLCVDMGPRRPIVEVTADGDVRDAA